MNHAPSRRLIKTSISLILSLALFALVLRYLNLNELLQVMAHVRWVWFAAMMTCLLVYQALRALRISVLAGGAMSFPSLFNTACQQAFLNMLLPLGLGEMGLVVLLRTRHQVGPHRGTAVLIVSRFMDVAVLCGIFLLALLFAWRKFPADSIRLGEILAGLVIAGALALWAILKLRRPEVSDRSAVFAFALGHLQVFRHALRDILSLSEVIVASAYSVVMWVVMFGFYYCAILALDFWLDPFSALFFFVLVALVWTLPVKGVAYVGTHHASWFFALRVLDVNPESAAVIASGSHLLFTACLTLLTVPTLASKGLRLLGLRQVLPAKATPSSLPDGKQDAGSSN